MSTGTQSPLFIGEKVYVEATVMSVSPGGGRIGIRMGRSPQQPTYEIDAGFVHNRGAVVETLTNEYQAARERLSKRLISACNAFGGTLTRAELLHIIEVQ